MSWNIFLFETSRGEKPVEKFIQSLAPPTATKTIHIINLLEKRGVNVITSLSHPNIHVSGHAYQKDIEVFIKAVKPHTVIPIHGNYSQFSSFKKFIKSSFENPPTVLLAHNGDFFKVQKKELSLISSTEIEKEFIDSSSLLPMPFETLRERLRIGELGLIIFFGAYSIATGWIFSPKLTILGLPLPLEKNQDTWVLEALENTIVNFSNVFNGENIDSESLKEGIRISLRRFFSKILGKKPVVIVQFELLD